MSKNEYEETVRELYPTFSQVFGLDQHTNIKLVTNPRKVKYRTKLKNDGYIVMRGSNTIYYTPEQKRHRHREENARKTGLDFAPWSVPAVIYKQTWLGA